MSFTLFDICLSYVVTNINIVDSFNNYPEVVGEKIFNEAQAREIFTLRKNPQGSVQALRLFSAAYGATLLSEINIRRAHVMINNYIEHLQLFTCLTKLDVAYCGLGDDHELLAHIAKLDRLQVLVLCGNGLSNNGIQKMTAPVRVMQKGPLNLHSLDLSENSSLTAASLRYLRVFQHLAVIRLSATGISHPCCRQTCHFLLSHSQNLQVTNEDCLHVQQAFYVKTTGWAASLFRTWLNEFQQKPHIPHVMTQIQKFYGRKRKREDFVQANAAIIPEKLLLVSRCLCSCSSPLDQPSLDKTQAKLHRCHKSKQQQQSDQLHSLESQSHTSQTRWKHPTEEDLFLLNQYI
ncbi:leucine-rich repeat-containing protein 42-like isoform X2 [Pomacea canaliculata]|nr:leucine-rich repeat-containing protein 42-like isoform X2 [Pomacea canaliculata]